jgi:hypothetical protein
MKYEDIIAMFEDVCDKLCPTPLTFLYDRVWAMNGAPSSTYPAMLVEANPDFDLAQFQSNNKAGIQTFSGKLFFFDTYYQEERGSKKLYKKQSELNELALKIIAEMRRRDKRINFGGGFLAFDVHNAKLIEVFIPFTYNMQIGCDLLDFTTCHV